MNWLLILSIRNVANSHLTFNGAVEDRQPSRLLVLSGTGSSEVNSVKVKRSTPDNGAASIKAAL